MNFWDIYQYFAFPSIVLWLVSIIFILFKKRNVWIDVFALAGTLIFLCFIVLYWKSVDRPPMRTMGETRLWFALFIAGIGYFVYKIWKYDYLFGFYLIIAIVFACINIFKPEIHSKTLMPALQSFWFIPHVVGYIMSYAMLGAATIMGCVVLTKRQYSNKTLHALDKLVYIGFGLLVSGMIMGAVWAKEAWGHYWSWDPKETWAFVTSIAYLIFIHLRFQHNKIKLSLWILVIAFVLLLITWKGVNYLPSAKNSIHVYSNE